MSDDIDTGGPAFPWNRVGCEGMTLRDYFAAKAMVALIPTHPDAASIAMMAFDVADAMLKAREAKP